MDDSAQRGAAASAATTEAANRSDGASPGGDEVADRTASDPGVLNRLAFAVLWHTIGRFTRWFFRLRIVDHPRLSGAHVLAGNHTSFIDPLLVGAASRRRVFFVMTSLHYRSPILGWFYRLTRCIPLAPRGSNRAGIQAARAVLARGHVLGIFPEGGISRDGLLQLGNPGVVSIVLAEGVPVVPFAIEGAHAAMPLGKWPRPRRITVRFGAPILAAELQGLAPHDRKARLHRATRRIMDEIAALSGQSSREAQLAARDARG